MQKWKVYTREWKMVRNRRHPAAEPDFIPELKPIMTVNARTANAALRIAKQKNVACPIIGPAAWEH